MILEKNVDYSKYKLFIKIYKKYYLYIILNYFETIIKNNLLIIFP